MSKSRQTEKELSAELDYLKVHIAEEYAKQDAERQAYFNNPDNAQEIAAACGRRVKSSSRPQAKEK